MNSSSFSSPPSGTDERTPTPVAPAGHACTPRSSLQPHSLASTSPFLLSAAFLTQTVQLDDCTVKFEIWDTAGQERYRSLAPMVSSRTSHRLQASLPIAALTLFFSVLFLSPAVLSWCRRCSRGVRHHQSRVVPRREDVDRGAAAAGKRGHRHRVGREQGEGKAGNDSRAGKGEGGK